MRCVPFIMTLAVAFGGCSGRQEQREVVVVEPDTTFSGTFTSTPYLALINDVFNGGPTSPRELWTNAVAEGPGEKYASAWRGETREYHVFVTKRNAIFDELIWCAHNNGEWELPDPYQVRQFVRWAAGKDALQLDTVRVLSVSREFRYFDRYPWVTFLAEGNLHWVETEANPLIPAGTYTVLARTPEK